MYYQVRLVNSRVRENTPAYYQVRLVNPRVLRKYPVYYQVRLVNLRFEKNTPVYYQVRLIDSRVRDTHLGILSSAPTRLAWSRQTHRFMTKCA